MPHVDNHAPGSFCWIELAVPDQDTAKKFYAPLFGWDNADFPMGPEGYYRIFRQDGRDVGGCMAMNDEMKKMNVPPHWMLYIAVASADETAAKAQAAGATLIVPAFDVFNMGRMAVIKDPTGAVFSIWQPMTHRGIGIAGDPGSLCWADLSTPDVEKASAFYKTVFGWDIAPGEHDKSGYLHIKNGEQFIGGIPPAAHRPPGVPPHWMIYFLVENCEAATAKAKELGATIFMGPQAMENVGTMTFLMDTQKAAFALFQSARRG